MWRRWNWIWVIYLAVFWIGKRYTTGSTYWWLRANSWMCVLLQRIYCSGVWEVSTMKQVVLRQCEEASPWTSATLTWGGFGTCGIYTEGKTDRLQIRIGLIRPIRGPWSIELWVLWLEELDGTHMHRLFCWKLPQKIFHSVISEWTRCFGGREWRRGYKMRRMLTSTMWKSSSLKMWARVIHSSRTSPSEIGYSIAYRILSSSVS
jgi:hypothetical protein